MASFVPLRIGETVKIKISPYPYLIGQTVKIFKINSDNNYETVKYAVTLNGDPLLNPVGNYLFFKAFQLERI